MTTHPRGADDACMADDDNIHPASPALDFLDWPVPARIDDVLSLYTAWRDEAAAVEETYRRWCAAAGAERDRRHGAYIAALDQEQAAAIGYAIAAMGPCALLQSLG